MTDCEGLVRSNLDAMKNLIRPQTYILTTSLRLIRVFRMLRSQLDLLVPVYESGAYISENSTHHYLRNRAYLEQKPGQNRVKEWSNPKIKAIFELITL